MENEQSEIVSPSCFWVWADDNKIVIHPAGVLLITQAEWDSCTDAIKTRFRPIDASDGRLGFGLVIDNILVVLLD